MPVNIHFGYTSSMPSIPPEKGALVLTIPQSATPGCLRAELHSSRFPQVRSFVSIVTAVAQFGYLHGSAVLEGITPIAAIGGFGGGQFHRHLLKVELARPELRL